jgi:hypothetical protein
MDWQNQHSKNGYTPKSNLHVQCKSIKIPVTFITEMEKSTLKFIWKYKRLWIAKAILSKKTNTGGITILDFKLHYRSIAIKIGWYWHKNIYEDQWNRIDDADINPGSYVHLIFDKGAKHIGWRKDSLFTKCCRENWISACRKLKLDLCFFALYEYQVKVD